MWYPPGVEPLPIQLECGFYKVACYPDQQSADNALRASGHYFGMQDCGLPAAPPGTQPPAPTGGGSTPPTPVTPTQPVGVQPAEGTLCANLANIPPCVGAWPQPAAPPSTDFCDRWTTFVTKIVQLGKLLLQVSGGPTASRLDGNWVKNVVCACIDFDPGQLRGMPPLDFLYQHVQGCDFSDAYLAIAAAAHDIDGESLKGAYAVKAALEALASIEYGVGTGYAQEQAEGQHSETGIGI